MTSTDVVVNQFGRNGVENLGELAGRMRVMLHVVQRDKRVHGDGKSEVVARGYNTVAWVHTYGEL